VGWVGPKPDHLQWVADVEAQRREARESGMEVIPSSPPLKSMEDAKIWADRIGPPLLERRDGKIARRRLTAADVAAAVRDVEVLSTIGVQCTFERAIVPARHIVVVAVGNGRGNAVYLPEMEQSLRFDGQVLLRECPAPHLSPELQARLGDGAVQVASRLGWLGPLTVEYLLSADNHAWFYRFHGALPDGYWLIESVAGVDLVAASLSLAVGDALNWTQEEIPVQGHAIQLPIYALKTGVLEVLQLPEGALALRAEGATVQPGECGRVAGLMVTAPTRQAALVRAQVLLRDVHVEGIESNLEHLLATLGKREVWDGKMNDHL
jgi:acetyl/propionyl-CoA carboxylase alpha subunit